MDDYVAVIGEDPRPLVESFNMIWGCALRLQLELNCLCYCFCADSGITAADDEKIGYTGKFPQVQQQDILALLAVGNLGRFLR